MAQIALYKVNAMQIRYDNEDKKKIQAYANKANIPFSTAARHLMHIGIDCYENHVLTVEVKEKKKSKPA